MSGFVPSAFFPVGAAPLAGVTPPAATSEAVASGGSVTNWTFGAFTDPDGRIASYSATLVTVTGSGSLSGSGLGPYSITGTADGDAYTVELDALDGDGGVLATAVHTVTIEGEGLAAPTYTAPSAGDYVIGGYHDFDGVDEYIDFGRITSMEMDAGDPFSISQWFKRTGSQNAFLDIRNSANQIVVYENVANQLAITIRFDSTQYTKVRNSILSSDWMHVLVTSNGSSVRAWIDGVEIASWSATTGSYPPGPATWDATTSVKIGATTGGFYMDGQIAEVAMWSTDQSANVAAIYNSRARHDLMDLATPPDLFYAPLTIQGDDPGSGGSVAEVVANNDGTGVNMETADAVLPTAPTTVTSTLTKALDIATSVVTTTKVENVPNGGGGTGSSFP